MDTRGAIWGIHANLAVPLNGHLRYALVAAQVGLWVGRGGV